MASGSRGGGNWCAAPNCQNSRKKGWRLFSFPKDEERCKRWVQNCWRNDLRNKPVSYLHANCCLCSDHFEASQFMNFSNKNCRLIWCAVPTLFDVPNPPKTLAIKRALPTRHALTTKKSRKQKGGVADDKGLTLPNILQSAVTDLPTDEDLYGLSSLPIPRESSPVAGTSAVKELSPNKHVLKISKSLFSKNVIASRENLCLEKKNQRAEKKIIET